MSNFKYIKNNNINRKKWNDCVSRSVNSRVYGLSWYLDIVCENWDGIIFGDYDVVFPVIFKKIFFLKKSYHPLFCQQLGPFYKNRNVIKRKFTDLFDEILVKYFNRYIYQTTSDYDLELSKNGIYFPYWRPRTNLILDLNQTYNEIKNGYNKNTIRNLKKSKLFNLKIVKGIDVDSFSDLYKTNLKIRKSIYSLKSLFFKNSNYLIIEKLISVCLNKKKGQLIAVSSQEGSIISAAFFLSCFKRKIMLFNVTKPNHKQYHAMTFLIDYFIQSNCEEDILLDFEGSNIEGVKKFYAGFGSRDQKYSMVLR